MTEPTDAELIALLGDRQFSTIGAVREAPSSVAQFQSQVASTVQSNITARRRRN